MRLWSIHPCYLDPKGLVALWRESLLAQAVLAGKTNGYRNHPQLDRFKASASPITFIDAYLKEIHLESLRRGYRFNESKIGRFFEPDTLDVTDGQLQYEWNHLLIKLKIRDIDRHQQYKQLKQPLPHPLFHVIKGDIAPWEVVTA